MTSTPVADSLRSLVPDTCIHVHGEFDVNRDWPCQRAAQLYKLGMFADNIASTELRARRVSGYRAERLARYLADEAERMPRIFGQVLDALTDCTA